jgi:hypothetical protein
MRLFYVNQIYLLAVKKNLPVFPTYYNEKASNMKNLIFTIFLLLCIRSAQSQSIPNGDFENWTTHSWLNPAGFVSSNTEAISAGASCNATQITDKKSGSYAIRIETTVMDNDTLMGYGVWGLFNQGPTAGVDYTQRPEAITGYYKYNIVSGDKGYIGAWFWKAGSLISINLFPITGSQGTYTKFNYPINFSSSDTPDSVTVGFTSSDPFVRSSRKVGSWLILDSLAFSGAGITQQLPNNDFETWTTSTSEEPQNWANVSYQLSASNVTYIEKTTDSQNGTYALKLTSRAALDGEGKAHFFHYTFSGNDYFNEYNSGFPYTLTRDTVVLNYKYIPVKNDSAKLEISFKKDNNFIFERDTMLSASAVYKKVKFPIWSNQSPDTLQVYIYSSNKNDSSGLGSVLYIDNIHLKSTEIPTNIITKTEEVVSVFPNPTEQFISIQLQNSNIKTVDLMIYEMSGKLVMQNKVAVNTPLDISKFTRGIYIYEIKQNSIILAKGKLVKK